GGGLVEAVAGVVRGQVEVVQRRLGAAARDDGPAAVQGHPDVAVDMPAGLVDEAVQGALERGEPLAVVDQFAPALLDLPLVAGQFALDGDVLQLLVGGDQGDGAGRLVHLAGLDADEAVLDHVDPADALGARPLVELLDRLEHGDRLAVDGHRDALLEADDDLVGLTGEGRVLGVLVDVLDRGVPDVLEEAGLYGAAEDVLVDGVRRLLGGRDGQALVLAEGDGLVAGHGVVADRGDALQVGGEGDDAGLEADLVVALAGAAVGDRGRAVLLRGGHQVLDDGGPRQRGDQRVAVHVEGVGLDRREAVLVGELVLGVRDLGLDGAAGQGALADDVQVLAALADVDRNGDDLGARLLGDPADGDGGVQTA